jgi:GxxExxY protein
MDASHIEKIGHTVIGCAIEVHRVLGPGLLEAAYEECLAYELNLVGLRTQGQLGFNIRYKEIILPRVYRTDLIVEELVVLELKAVDFVHDLHRAQLLSYLKFGEYPLGYILNFHVKRMQQGIVRMVNNYDKPLLENNQRF